MFERFTDRARRVIVLAQEEAGLLGHDYIGTEHLLLGLIHEGDGIGATTLGSLGISIEAARQAVEDMVGQGQRLSGGHIPFTPRAKKVMEYSLREALELGHSYIGTEHILLGLIREGEGVFVQVLEKLGVELSEARDRVLARAGSEPEGAQVESTGSVAWPQQAVADPGEPPFCPRCRASLSQTAAYRVLDVPAHEGEGARTVPFTFCRRCGTWLGTLS